MSKTVEAHVLREYMLLKEMGSGAYGHVWQAKSKKNNQIYALKKVFDAFRNSVDAQRTYREVEVLYHMDHPNITKLHRVIKSKNNKDLYLLFEFMEADLHSVVGTNILEKMHHIFIFYQILKGIHYIHSAQLIHRDLKPSNVLINSECAAKICDFGLIRSLASNDPINNEDQIILSEEVATKWYRAPQLLLGSRNYGKAVDIWSFGCIVAELLIGKPLFAGSSTLNQFQKILEFVGHQSKTNVESLNSPIAQQLLDQIKIKQKSFRQYFSGVDPIFFELIECSLSFNPNQRLTTQELMKLEIFGQFTDDIKGVAYQPIIPQINDNMRLSTKAYRQKIYHDIDQRYEPLPFKQYKIDDFKQHSLDNKRVSQKNRSNSQNSNKKRALSSKKKISTSIYNTLNNKNKYLSEILHKNKSSSNVFKKVIHSSHSVLKNSPYFKSLNYQNNLSTSSSNTRKNEGNLVNVGHRVRNTSQTKKNQQVGNQNLPSNISSMIDKHRKLQADKSIHSIQASSPKQITSPYEYKNGKSTKNIKKGARHKLQQIDKKNILKSIGINKSQKLIKYLK